MMSEDIQPIQWFSIKDGDKIRVAGSAYSQESKLYTEVMIVLSAESSQLEIEAAIVQEAIARMARNKFYEVAMWQGEQ